MKSYLIYLFIVVSVIILAGLFSFLTVGGFFEYIVIITLVLTADNIVQTQELKKREKVGE